MTYRKLFIAAVALASLSAISPAYAATCTSISVDVGQGVSDGGSTGPVRSLQVFLKESGYLTATPNGYFGPATLAATKIFQASRGISATGFAGPLTRTAIHTVGCASTPAPTTPTTPTTPSSNASISFTAPTANSELNLGQTYTVSWKNPNKADLSLVIEDSDGVTAGVVSSYLGLTTTNYSWEVGFMSVSGKDQAQVVSPGTYRLRLQSRTFGKAQSDAVSPYFLISAPPLNISQVMPSTLAADGRSAGVLYGTGFTAGIGAYLDDSYDKALTLLYVSSDAKIMVFSIPSTVPAGRYRLVLRNNYGASTEGGSIVVTK